MPFASDYSLNEDSAQGPQSKSWALFINRVFNHFHTTGVWPTFAQFDRLVQLEDGLDLLRVLMDIPSDLVRFDRSRNDPGPNAPIQITIKAMATCVGADTDMALFFDALRWFAKVELEFDPGLDTSAACTVGKSEYLAHLSMTTFGDFWLNATKTATLFLAEGSALWSGFGDGPNGEWYFSIRRTIRYFSSVNDATSYYEAFASLQRGFDGTQNAGLGNALASPTTSATAEESSSILGTAEGVVIVPDQVVFVVMPFAETWSDTSYRFIGDAVANVPRAPNLRVLRADEISRAGIITEQITTAIQTSALVVADITQTRVRRKNFGKWTALANGNVMWELGYAMALNKPWVLVNQNPSESPFDLAHYRQISYSNPPTDRESAWLTQVVNDNLPWTA